MYQIFSRENPEHGPVGVYSRSCGDEFDFSSASSARRANCHGTYEDVDVYKINKYKVTYELIEEDVDGEA